MDTLWKILTRRKIIETVSTEDTRLNRVLNTFDLTALGVGSTLGVGVYILAGQVAKDTAGPAVILSFFIAAVTSVFAGLCYAEFGARVPRAGSAYIYSYVCVGEFVAFIIGWNLILEYIIGAASVAKGLSLYVDGLMNDTMKNAFIDVAPIHAKFLADYFDFFSFGISVLLAVALAFGMKESTIGNNIFTSINIFIVLFIIVAGSFHLDIKNWEVPANSTDDSIQNGGFFPFGVEGMIKGAATCFYGFVGFDCIATAGEEVRNPRKSIPMSIILSLFIVFLAYFGTSAITTLMVPYYLEDASAPLPHAFHVVGWDWAKWVVSIGAISGMCASLFGAMFPLPRIIFAMGSDGLVFKFLAKVHPRFQTPVVGTISAGIFTGLMSAIFDLKQLVNMMSIGTLLAYTIVAASVLLLRYTDSTKFSINNEEATTSDSSELLINDEVNTNVVSQFFNIKRQQNPNKFSERMVATEIFIYCLLCIFVGLCIKFLNEQIRDCTIWAIVITSIIVAFILLILISIALQPTSKKELAFKVPLVPIIPALSILVNIYLMLMLDDQTWIRFGIWMGIGIPMYYYCVRHTTVHATNRYSKNNSLDVVDSKPNGIHNLTFVDETKTPTLRLEAPPSKDIEKQQHDAIAQLDEILEKETVELYRRNSDVSVVSSGVASREENVIADVHRGSTDNVSLNVALSSPSDVALNGDVVNNELYENFESSDGCVKNSDPSVNYSDRSVNYSDPSVNYSDQSVKNSDHRVKNSGQPIEHTDNKIEATPNGIILNIDDDHIYEDIEDNLPKLENIPQNNVPKTPIPPPLPSPDYEEVYYAIPRPTVSNLKSVTLKKVEKVPENLNKKDEVLPEENIKPSEKKSSKFFNMLNETLLKAPSMLPNIPYVTNKKNDKNKEEIKPNENVIEEHIDTEKAKEKFKEYVGMRTENSYPTLEELKSQANSPRKRKISTSNQLEGPEDFEEHKQKMSGVFRSMNLKKVEDMQKNDEECQKSQSLRVKFPEKEDRIEHKQKMQDIFKSIQLIRKDSQKVNDQKSA